MGSRARCFVCAESALLAFVVICLVSMLRDGPSHEPCEPPRQAYLAKPISSGVANAVLPAPAECPSAGPESAPEDSSAAPDSPFARLLAITRLADRDTPEAWAVVVGRLTEDTSPMVRAAAALELSRWRDAGPALRRAWESERNGEAQRALVEALGRAGDEASARLLLGCLSDSARAHLWTDAAAWLGNAPASLVPTMGERARDLRARGCEEPARVLEASIRRIEGSEPPPCVGFPDESIQGPPQPHVAAARAPR